MILPGLISLAFYKKAPSASQVALGLLATVALSAVLGYYSPAGPLGQLGSVLVAVAGGVILYAAIWAYLQYSYRPRRVQRPIPTSPTVPP
jgi:hypothetical protein